ncbi:chromosomal replication initiator protein DnaA [Patescibacteria group bacterium]
MDNLENIWNEALDIIRISVSSAIFVTWFSQTHISSAKDSGKRVSFEIGCPTSFAKATIEQRYFGLVQDALVKVVGKPCDTVFIVKQKPQKEGVEIKVAAPLFETETVSDQHKQFLSNARIRPGFTFENFAVSSSNQMAWAAADAVSKSPGKAYNPLFIWGGVGVGKTHLMFAVGDFILKKDDQLKIIFCTGEDFTNDIVEGIRNKTTQSFRNKYRKLDLLLIDDIQFIAGKDAVQEEFFHTFNAVTSAGGQIILTSDKPPSEISKLEERLKSRFEAGLIVDMAAPDFELRCAITQIKAKEKGIDIDMEIVQTIAGNIDSARKIEGILTTISLKKEPITQEVVEQMLGKGDESNNKTLKTTPPELISSVCKYYSIGKRSLLGASRVRPVARPRQVLMYLLRTHLGLTLEEVGRVVGGRDHSTVMHAVEKITQLASTNVQIREDILGIKNTS